MRRQRRSCGTPRPSPCHHGTTRAPSAAAMLQEAPPTARRPGAPHTLLSTRPTTAPLPRCPRSRLTIVPRSCDSARTLKNKRGLQDKNNWSVGKTDTKEPHFFVFVFFLSFFFFSFFSFLRGVRKRQFFSTAALLK